MGSGRTRVAVLGWLATVLVAVLCISSSAAALVSIPYPYWNPNGGAVPVTIDYTNSGQPTCSISIPITTTGSSYYTINELFIIFLQSPYDTYSPVVGYISASWNLNFGQGVAFTSSDGTSIPYGSANFLRIPAQTFVPSSAVSSNYATLYLGMTLPGNYNVSAAVVQEVSPYSYNQNTTTVMPYTANVLLYPYYYSVTTTYYEICSGNLSNWEATWGTNSVYRFWLPQSLQTGEQTLSGDMANGAVSNSLANFQNNVNSNPTNYTIGFDHFYAWSWPPLITSYQLYGQSYAILFNLPPRSLPASEAQWTTFRFSYWPSVSGDVPLGSSVVAAISWGNDLLLQPTFTSSTSSCSSYSAADVTITLLTSYTPVLAAQPCFASNNQYQVESFALPNYFFQVSDFEVNDYGGTILISDYYSSSAAQQCQSYSCMVSVTVNSSYCGMVTFPPVSVPPQNYYFSTSMIGKWQVLVPTILAVIFAIMVILLVARLAGYRARFERAGEYQSVMMASPTETTPLTGVPATGFPTSHMPMPSAPPAPSTIPYNPYQPQNQGSSHNYYALYGIPQPPQPAQQPPQPAAEPAQH